MAKIVGKAAGGDLLVSMPDDEAANIMGYGWTGESGFSRSALEPGRELPISKQWERLRSIRDAQRTFDGVAKTLEEVSRWLRTVPGTLDAAAPEKPATAEDEK